MARATNARAQSNGRRSKSAVSKVGRELTRISELIEKSGEKLLTRKEIEREVAESRTNPMPADRTARGGHRWPLAHPWRSRRPAPARSRASLHTPSPERCTRDFRPGPCGVLITATGRWRCSTITSTPSWTWASTAWISRASLGFRDADRRHLFDHSASSPSPASAAQMWWSAGAEREARAIDLKRTPGADPCHPWRHPDRVWSKPWRRATLL